MVHSMTDHPETHIQILDPVGQTSKWPNKITELRSYHSFPYKNDATADVVLRSRVETTLDNESDLASQPQPLWRPGSPLQPTSSPRSVSFSHPMSPNSRTQAIARGQRELMEMVRDLPESFYELSLKDLVEKKSYVDAKPEEIIPSVKEVSKEKEMKIQKSSSRNVKKRGNKRKVVRTRSTDNERFLLKTSVFPVLFGRKKSKKNLGGSGSFRIASMQKQQKTGSESMKGGGEKDWWKKKKCISSESDDSSGFSNSVSSRSSSSSSRSSCSSGRHKKRFLPSFCFFIGKKIRGRK